MHAKICSISPHKIASLPQVLLFLEISSVLCVLGYLYLVSKQRPNAWILGGMASLLSLVFFIQQHLYASAILNGIYALQAIKGYVNWTRKFADLQVAYRLSLRSHLLFLLIVLTIAIVFQWQFGMVHSSGTENKWSFNAFYLDILFGLVGVWATFLEIRKELSCWWYWMFSNLAYAILYGLQSAQGQAMFVYTCLMFFLFLFSVYVFYRWRQGLKTASV